MTSPMISQHLGIFCEDKKPNGPLDLVFQFP